MPLLRKGYLVVMREGVDDVPGGTLCQVLSRDEEPNYAPGDYPTTQILSFYRPEDVVLVRSVAGYLAWTAFENLIPICGIEEQDEAALRALFLVAEGVA